MDLILASTSTHRRSLLERLQIPFRCASPGVDEEAFKTLGLSPIELAERLARAKADAISDQESGRHNVVIGSDQLVAFQDQVLGKPGTSARAIEQLLAMSGQEHELITAMVVRLGDRVVGHTDIARLRFRDLTRLEIERYVAADQPLDCAGAYKIESLGITLFERIECADHTAIVGLPLLQLTRILRDFGFPVP